MKIELLKKLRTVLAILLFASISIGLSAQDPPPPPPDPSGGGSNGPVGGGASLKGGIFMLVVMGTLYGGKKVYDVRKDFNDHL